MVVDAEHVSLAVTRELSNRQHHGSPARVIAAARSFAISRTLRLTAGRLL